MIFDRLADLVMIFGAFRCLERFKGCLLFAGFLLLCSLCFFLEYEAAFIDFEAGLEGFNSVYGKCYNLGCLVVERLLFG